VQPRAEPTRAGTTKRLVNSRLCIADKLQQPLMPSGTGHKLQKHALPAGCRFGKHKQVSLATGLGRHWISIELPLEKAQAVLLNRSPLQVQTPDLRVREV
jgi:hypothetical protein